MKETEYDKLYNFAKLFAKCPCCYETEKCQPYCEFVEGGYEHMEEAREALAYYESMRNKTSEVLPVESGEV